METLNRDPTETTLTIDYDRNIIMGWTNHKPTINQWVKDFSKFIEVAKDNRSATANNIPFDYVRKIKLYKPKNYSEESREKLRTQMNQNRVKKS